MDAETVSQTSEKRGLMRAVVEMEINDIVAIESVRLARRLMGLVRTMRAAHRRGRPSIKHEAEAMRFALRAAQPKRKRPRRHRTAA